MVKLGVTISVILSCFSVAQCQFLDCGWVMSRDCTTYDDGDAECGTDGVTYPNICYFAQAQCANSFLHILHRGACLPSETSTTPSPVSAEERQEAIMDHFCTQLSHMDCDTNVSEVCGTDNNTYLNFCEFDKAQCTHRKLHVLTFGPCPN